MAYPKLAPPVAQVKRRRAMAAAARRPAPVLGGPPLRTGIRNDLLPDAPTYLVESLVSPPFEHELMIHLLPAVQVGFSALSGAERVRPSLLLEDAAITFSWRRAKGRIVCRSWL